MTFITGFSHVTLCRKPHDLSHDRINLISSDPTYLEERVRQEVNDWGGLKSPRVQVKPFILIALCHESNCSNMKQLSEDPQSQAIVSAYKFTTGMRHRVIGRQTSDIFDNFI